MFDGLTRYLMSLPAPLEVAAYAAFSLAMALLICYALIAGLGRLGIEVIDRT